MQHDTGTVTDATYRIPRYILASSSLFPRTGRDCLVPAREQGGARSTQTEGGIGDDACEGFGAGRARAVVFRRLDRAVWRVGDAVEGPSGSAFYTPPSPTPAGSAGELVWYRPATVNLNVTLPSIKAWTVLYQSTDEHGNRDWVTGTVIVPTAKWSGKGERPVVSYAAGTQGLAQSCAPSLQIVAGTEYDGGAIIESLKKGYAVTITDYQGYTNGAIPTYATGKAEGQAVLDAVRAGRQVPGSGISASAPVIVWGYSQGGQAASWAAELQSSYAPDVKMVGPCSRRCPRRPSGHRANSTTRRSVRLRVGRVIGLAPTYPERIPPRVALEHRRSRSRRQAPERVRDPVAGGIPRRQRRRIHDRQQDVHAAGGRTPVG